MTGLNSEKDTILQIACFVTDAQLNLLDKEGFITVIQHPQPALDRMDEWCTRTHQSTGLWSAVLTSTTTADEAASNLLKYIRQHVAHPRTALLAGNSVHADKAFLSKEPYRKVVEYLHYRILDVSTVKECARRWMAESELAKIPRKKNVHEAKQDILESIEEAAWYRRNVFHRVSSSENAR